MARSTSAGMLGLSTGESFGGTHARKPEFSPIRGISGDPFTSLEEQVAAATEILLQTIAERGLSTDGIAQIDVRLLNQDDAEIVRLALKDRLGGRLSVRFSVDESVAWKGVAMEIDALVRKTCQLELIDRHMLLQSAG